MASSCVRILGRRKGDFLKSVSRCIVLHRTESQTNHGERFSKLSTREFWQSQYQRPAEVFDWFLCEDVISTLVCRGLLNVASRKNFSKAATGMYGRVQPVNVLDLGCGQSVLPQCVYEWTPFPVAMHCLDFAPAAVHFQVQSLRAMAPGHRHSYACGVCASVSHLPYASNTFHLVIDKGTMDSLLKAPRRKAGLRLGAGPTQEAGLKQGSEEGRGLKLEVEEGVGLHQESGEWTKSRQEVDLTHGEGSKQEMDEGMGSRQGLDIRQGAGSTQGAELELQSGAELARQMLSEVERVLCRGGLFMQVTDEDPDSRLFFLETHAPPACQWTFSILTDVGVVVNGKECFVYSFTK